ncbi:MAG: c-type cytochrome, partial [Gemmatimonadetes bacterium]|nr:c-type cytochrome [Gemmatimonadota bacterium]
IRSANEIHIPVGRRIQVFLESRDVIHSFWVPNLQAKIDMVPGQRNVTWLQADRPGVYRGQCAEFCGMQHAHMAFILVAHPEEEWEAWLAREREPAPVPVDSVLRYGRQVMETTACALCHNIRGTRARGTTGPDLTHIGSRRTLAAGMLANNRGNLSGWIANPQVLKRGSLMPRVDLGPHELHALVLYLESLR